MVVSSTTSIILIIFLLLVIIFIFWKTSQNEKFSPYRGTGSCPPRTGYTYLDVYEQGDYYKNYPYIYPTPRSYTTNWYDLKRKEMEYNSDEGYTHTLSNDDKDCLCIPDNFYL